MLTKDTSDYKEKIPATIICKKCGVVHKAQDLHIEKIPLATGDHHLKTSCPACKNFIQFLRHSEPAFHFGRHKGRTIRDVAESDPSYLEWIMANSIGARSLRNAIREVLCKTQK